MADDKEDSPSPDPRDPSFWDESAPRHKRDDLVTTSAQSEQPDPAAQEKTAPRKTREELSHLTSLDKKRELYRKACAGQIKLSPPQVLAFFNNIAKHRNDMAEDDGRALRMIDDRQPRSVRALQIYAKITQEEKTRFLDQLFPSTIFAFLRIMLSMAGTGKAMSFLRSPAKQLYCWNPWDLGLREQKILSKA